MIALLWLVACGGEPEASAPATPKAEATPAWGAPKATQSGKYLVGLELVPATPPAGELFKVRATLTEKDGTPIDDGSVKLDARMPQHNHGMMTDPLDDPGICPEGALPAAGDCKHPGGLYEASGFKFHMGGEWTITVDVVGPRGPDSTSFVYEMQ